MANRNHGKPVSFWVKETDLLEKYNKMYYDKSYFLRQCMKKAVKDVNFYIELTGGYGVNPEND